MPDVHAVSIVPASAVHVGPIAHRMRAVDRLECAAFGHSSKGALRDGLSASALALTALVNGRPEAMFGVVVTNALESEGRAWMLGTDVVPRHARMLLSQSGAILDRLHQYARRLSNYVAVANRAAIAMLRRWGFTLGDDAMIFAGVPFLPFWREAHV